MKIEYVTEASSVVSRILISGLFISVFGFAAVDKFSGPVPEWFLKQFGSTFLATFPGIAAAYYGIATLEAATTLIFLLSLIAGDAWTETIRYRDGAKVSGRYIQWALIFAQLTFLVLSFGARLSHDFATAFQLFAYFALTFLFGKLYHRE